MSRVALGIPIGLRATRSPNRPPPTPRAERKARITGQPIEHPVFTADQANLRWSQYKNTSPEVMFTTISDEVFPFLRQLGTTLGGDGTTYSEHMKDARFSSPVRWPATTPTRASSSRRAVSTPERWRSPSRYPPGSCSSTGNA